MYDTQVSRKVTSTLIYIYIKQSRWMKLYFQNRNVTEIELFPNSGFSVEYVVKTMKFFFVPIENPKPSKTQRGLISNISL